MQPATLAIPFTAGGYMYTCHFLACDENNGQWALILSWEPPLLCL